MDDAFIAALFGRNAPEGGHSGDIAAMGRY
jgi:hypothetical protein